MVTDSPPSQLLLSYFQKLVSDLLVLAGRFEGPKKKIMMSYKREIPKLNTDNFSSWQGLMRLHLATISDSGCKYLDAKYKTPIDTLSFEDLAKKKNHSIMMIDIASALSYEEFDEIKDCKSAFDMWNKLKDIYGGDANVRKAKAESLRGQFYQMRMRED